MAQLNDTMVQGDLRVTGNLYSTVSAVTAAASDSLIIADSSNGNLMAKSGISFSSGGTGFLKQDGSWGTPTDTKVKVTAKTSGGPYQILGTSTASGSAGEAVFVSGITIDPTGTKVTATTFDGNATSATKVSITNQEQQGVNPVIDHTSYILAWDSNTGTLSPTTPVKNSRIWCVLDTAGKSWLYCDYIKALEQGGTFEPIITSSRGITWYPDDHATYPRGIATIGKPNSNGGYDGFNLTITHAGIDCILEYKTSYVIATSKQSPKSDSGTPDYTMTGMWFNGTAQRAEADYNGNTINTTYMAATAGTKTLSSNSETTIGTVNGSAVKVKLPTIPSAANNGALQLQLNGGTASNLFTANQSGNSTLSFSTGSTNGTFKVGSTEVSIAGWGTELGAVDMINGIGSGSDPFWTTDSIIGSSHSNGASVSNDWTRRTGAHLLTWLVDNARNSYGAGLGVSDAADMKRFGIMYGDYRNQDSTGGNIAGWKFLTSKHNTAYQTVQFKAIVSMSVWTSCTGNTTGDGIKGNKPMDFFGVVEVFARMGSTVATANLTRYGRLCSFYPMSTSSSNIGWTVKAKINSNNSIDWYIGPGASLTMTPTSDLVYSKISMFPIVAHGGDFTQGLTRVTSSVTCTNYWQMYINPVCYAGDDGQTVGDNTNFHIPLYMNTEGIWEKMGCRMHLPEKTAEADVRIGYDTTHRSYLCSTSSRQGVWVNANSHEDWLVWADNNGMGHLNGAATHFVDHYTGSYLKFEIGRLGTDGNTIYIV